MGFHPDAVNVRPFEHRLGGQFVHDPRALQREPVTNLLDVPGPFLFRDDGWTGLDARPCIRNDAVRRLAARRHRDERGTIDVEKDDQPLEPGADGGVGGRARARKIGGQVREQRFEPQALVQRLARPPPATTLDQKSRDERPLQQEDARQNPAVETRDQGRLTMQLLSHIFSASTAHARPRRLGLQE
jgi:hypothetical protein